MELNWGFLFKVKPQIFPGPGDVLQASNGSAGMFDPTSPFKLFNLTLTADAFDGNGRPMLTSQLAKWLASRYLKH